MIICLYSSSVSFYSLDTRTIIYYFMRNTFIHTIWQGINFNIDSCLNIEKKFKFTTIKFRFFSGDCTLWKINLLLIHVHIVTSTLVKISIYSGIWFSLSFFWNPLVHAAIISCLNYCNSLAAFTPAFLQCKCNFKKKIKVYYTDSCNIVPCHSE